MVSICFDADANTVKGWTIATDKDAGWEGPLQGSIEMSKVNIAKVGAAIVVSWKGWGHPNSAVEPAMQAIAFRTSINIWHEPEVELSAQNGKGYLQASVAWRQCVPDT